MSGELNNIKVNEDEIKQEIQKQVKSMPGQEKLFSIIIKKILRLPSNYKVIFTKIK